MDYLKEVELSLKEEYPHIWLALYHHRSHKDNPIVFENYLYMKSIYEDKNEFMVLQKATQSGASEYLIVRAMASLMAGNSIFYVMPTDDMKNIFVRDRFDRSLDYSPYYKKYFQALENKSDTDNVGLKHFGKGSINFVGSMSTRPFFSYPADELIIDEVDQCDQSNLAIANERLSASKCKTIIKVSNPTTNGFGINHEYNHTDMKKWHIKCDHCGEWINPDFFRHVVREVEAGVFALLDNDYDEKARDDIQMICDCGKPLNRFGKGQWIPEKPGEIKSGYIISKLFSTNVTIREMVEKFEDAQNNDTIMQRFYNGDLGLPFTSTGSKISFEMLNQCKRDYSMPLQSARVCVAGIDVNGDRLHTIIAEILPDGYLRIVFIGIVREAEDVFDLSHRYNVKFGCIDALPETRLSKRIVNRLPGFFMVYFPNIATDRVDITNKIIKVRRTESIDAVKEAICTQSIMLPKNADKLDPVQPNGYSELYCQINSSTRLYDEKRNMYVWQEVGQDHYLMSFAYLLTAKRLAIKAFKGNIPDSGEKI